MKTVSLSMRLFIRSTWTTRERKINIAATHSKVHEDRIHQKHFIDISIKRHFLLKIHIQKQLRNNNKKKIANIVILKANGSMLKTNVFPHFAYFN